MRVGLQRAEVVVASPFEFVFAYSGAYLPPPVAKIVAGCITHKLGIPVCSFVNLDSRSRTRHCPPVSGYRSGCRTGEYTFFYSSQVSQSTLSWQITVRHTDTQHQNLVTLIPTLDTPPLNGTLLHRTATLSRDGQNSAAT